MEKITSRRNPLCTHLKKLGTGKGYRDEHGEFLCDGIKLLEEAVKSGAAITAVLTASHIPFPLPVETRVYYTDRSIIDSLSPLKNPQDTLFTCKMPERVAMSDTAGTHILLDGVQDPGNVGTIIRTADAFGIDSVILTGGCADLYNPKTIRATMGALFRQRIFHLSMQNITQLHDDGVKFIGAAAGENSRDINDADLSNAIIVVGNEGQGLSGEVTILCHDMITIPTEPVCESLNVSAAAAIIMWEAVRVRRI